MGYVCLGVFVACVFGCLGSFIGGVVHGKKSAAAEYAEEQRLREKSENEFWELKSEINQEVFGNAEKNKADIASHADAAGRFNAINSRLRNNSKDRSDT